MYSMEIIIVALTIALILGIRSKMFKNIQWGFKQNKRKIVKYHMGILLMFFAANVLLYGHYLLFGYNRYYTTNWNYAFSYQVDITNIILYLIMILNVYLILIPTLISIIYTLFNITESKRENLKNLVKYLFNCLACFFIMAIINGIFLILILVTFYADDWELKLKDNILLSISSSIGFGIIVTVISIMLLNIALKIADE